MSSCCNNIDVDELFAYTTFKKVVVRHRSLGYVYYFSALAIFLYTGLYTIWLKEGYVTQIPFIGAVRSTVYQPKTITTSLNYCATADAPPTGSFASVLPCLYPDLASGLYSKVTSGEQGALMVGTRFSFTSEERDPTCANLDYSCYNFQQKTAKQSFYVGGIENSTILIQNAVSKATQQLYGGNKTLIIDSFDTTRPAAWMTGTNTGNRFQVPLMTSPFRRGCLCYL